jgi:hypothetical protein
MLTDFVTTLKERISISKTTSIWSYDYCWFQLYGIWSIWNKSIKKIKLAEDNLRNQKWEELQALLQNRKMFVFFMTSLKNDILLHRIKTSNRNELSMI